MLRKIFLLIVASVIASSVFAQSGTLKGLVKDPSTGEAIPFANVTVEKGGSIITGGMTDFDGNYTIKPIPPGKYTVKASYVGYSTKQIDGVVIASDKITFLNLDISAGVQITEVVIYDKPLIDPDQVSTGGSVSQEEIKKMPGRSAESVATTVAGVYSEDGNISSIRGAREEGTVYYIDGVKVRGSTSVPKSAMADVSVLTGGIAAKYGDATGGIISISTSGPSKQLEGQVDLVTSQFLDPYGYNLAEFSMSGPILHKTEVDRYDSTRTKKTPILGFRLSGNFIYTKDPVKSPIGVWQAKESTMNDLQSDLIRQDPQGIGVLYNALWLDETAFENVKYNKNCQRMQSTINGRLDYRLSDYVDLTVSGSMDYVNTRNYSFSNQLFNSDNNGKTVYTSWRSYVRLTQRFPDREPEEGGTEDIVKNAFYRIQFDYSNTMSRTFDVVHKDNLFNYGHVGTFETSKINSYEWTDTIQGLSSGAWMHNGFRDTAVAYTPSQYNPDVAAYTSEYYDMYDPSSYYYRNLSNIEAFGALLNGQGPSSVYGMWTSPGTPYNGYSKSDYEQFRISASGSADVKDHEISVGIEFEQRADRSYSVSPVALWTLARQLTNFHILELDVANPHYTTVLNSQGQPVFSDTVYYDRLVNESSQALFDYRLREELGLPTDGRDWIDIDSYDPSQLKLDYFSAEELLNSGNSYVSYRGYDHHGNKLKGTSSLSDFFNETDEYGRYTRPVPAFRPTYSAVYIQDKFGFKDLVFNVGLRVDRYDANQMVLKDPYVLGETYKAGDDASLELAGGSHPSGIGEDYVVYVDNIDDPSSIMGYRNGDNWYDAAGTSVEDPSAIQTSTGMAPYLVVPDAALNESAFEDYKPQITPMPRIAFSFPISDVALFFAHYDVLSTRPTDGYNRMNPISYMFLVTDPNELANPNLKPQKTIDYELGFQQKLNDLSALKISAFYREMRDMIQVIPVDGGYPANYTTYGNLDFGTVKGFQVDFMRRRAGNVAIRANYSLQFANGTGSDPNTAINLIRQGLPNIRFTNPLDIDQRHRVQVVVDFRFGGDVSQRPYNGPKLFGRDILQNTGANFVVQAGSGKPYSKRDIYSNNLKGSVNGSRMPWSKSVNMRIDRDFILTLGNAEEEGSKGRELSLNVYLDILNVLNTKNIYGVYSKTGNPDDDGYLDAAKNQIAISQQVDEIAYRNYYWMQMNYPFMYSMPRTIQLGLSLSF